MATTRPGRQGAPLATLHRKGALDLQGPYGGRIQILYIYFIACTVTLGGNQTVDDTPEPPYDLAGLDLILNSCPTCPIDMACVLLSWPQCTCYPANFCRAPLPLCVSAALVL